MNGGFPTAASKRSVVLADQVKKSPEWTNAVGDRFRANAALTGSTSIPTDCWCNARNSPSPHDGSSMRSVGFGEIQLTKVLATAGDEKNCPSFFCSCFTSQLRVDAHIKDW